MTTSFTYEQLIEKIVMARMALKKVSLANHSNYCPIEDPESYAPCNCGADGDNAPIEEALRILKL